MTLLSPDLERRAALELRAIGDRITGHAAVFNRRSLDLGGFVEIVRPQAVDRALTADIVALFNHETAAVLGRTPKTLQLRKDETGLAFDLDPAPTQAGRETLELVRRRDLTGASFGFKTLTDRWSNEGGTTVRELLDIDIIEISLTAFPAYQQTDVTMAQRALQAFQHGQARPSQTGYGRIAWLRMRHTARGVSR